jgi:hypothetical protein
LVLGMGEETCPPTWAPGVEPVTQLVK